MLSGKIARNILSNPKHGARWIKKVQRTLATTTILQPANETEKYIQSIGKIHIPEISITETVWANIDKWADKTAVVCNETGRSYKYADLRKRSINLAKALRARLKLQPQDVVAILLPNVPEFPIALFGIIEASLIVTSVNPIYKAEEIAVQLKDSNAKAIITLGEYHSRAVDAINLNKSNLPILTIKTKQNESTVSGAIDFAEFCEKETNFDGLRPVKSDDVILMPYSSGTTGLPKGVELTDGNIVANMFQCVEMANLFRETTKDNQDVVPAVLPMFHIYGMTINALKSLELGSKLITLPKFTPDIYINMLKEYKPQHLFVVPPIVIFLSAHSLVTKEHLDSVLTIMTGAAPVGASDIERLSEKAGREIRTMQGYGMTETSPVICMTPLSRWKECLGSIGMPIANTEVKICAIDDKTATPLGPNIQGELLLRGPQVMPRYHNNPQATEEVFHDGWLRTGDMAYYDENKIFWITDRLKELIKVKGFQVAPAELEAIVRDHPSVADAAVIGVPHPIHGEVPKAFVVAKTNCSLNTEEVQKFVEKKVASYKKLEGGITVLDAIPKNPSGKILRRKLKEEYGDK